jgi:hypothetical protein
MINLIKIIERVKKYQNIKTDKEYAEIIGISTPDFSKRKKTGTLLPLIIDWGISNKVNLHWILTGEGKMVLEPEKESRVAEDPPIYKEGNEDPKVVEMLMMTSEILKSDTDYALSLASNIRSFHKSVQLDREIHALKGRIEKIEDKLSVPDGLKKSGVM